MQPALCRGSIMHARHIIIPQERKAVKCSAVDLSIFCRFFFKLRPLRMRSSEAPPTNHMVSHCSKWLT